jgi:hypothetical protein
MNINKLSFGKAIVIDSSLAEIIIDEGIEMNLAMVTEYHNWISQNLSDPCMVLVNRINSYTYSFNAQLALGSLEQIKAVAVVTNCDKVIKTTEFLKTLPRENPWNPTFFSNRDQALLWLEIQWDLKCQNDNATETGK